MQDLTGGAPILLDASGKQSIISKLNSQYSIAAQDGTALFYAAHKGLANLKANENAYPANLDSVNMVTFTDGLDNASRLLSQDSPIEGQTFSSSANYVAYLADQIAGRSIASMPVTAYSIGVRGSDVQDISGFQNNLQQIASVGKSQELTNFSDVQSTFNSIANSLNISHSIVTFKAKITAFDPGVTIRMTFDITNSNVTTPTASTKYIEATLGQQDGTLTNITYVGVSSSAGAGPITGTRSGVSFIYEFPDFTGYVPDGGGSQDQANIKQWYIPAGSGTWQKNSEYTPDGASETSVERRSTVMYLVLDASKSMNTTQIGQVRTAVINFIESLYNQYQNGGGSTTTPGGGGGGSTWLSPGVWTNGTITSSAQVMEYSFNVTSGTYYYIWWNDSYEGNGTKTLDITVSARFNNSGTYIFSGSDSAWNTPKSFTANTSDTVIISVVPYNSGSTGTFAIAYSMTNSRP